MMNKTIIIDMKDIAETLDTMFSKYCQKVISFTAPKQAFKYLIANGPSVDYIISDINMPDLKV